MLGRWLAFTRYCDYQSCMVYSIQTGGRKGILILSNDRALVLLQGGQCRWAGGGGGDGLFVHDSLEVNEYLVKAKSLAKGATPSLRYNTV